jgi:hypothetical protein
MRNNKLSYREGTYGFSAWSLGRGLINAQPQAYGCELDECEVVSRELVVAGCQAPAVLLHQVARPGKDTD